jgi:guanylate kinase
MSNLSIVISAPSGAGKSTIIKRVLEKKPRLDFAVSSTTRACRECEEHGEDYYFLSQEEFKDEIENEGFVEWAVVHDNYYGTSKKELDRIISIGKIPLFDVDVQGARSLKRSLYGAVFIFILPPSLEELERRLRNRKTDSEEQIKIRLGKARNEITQSSIFDYIVINEEVGDAVSDVLSIIRSSELQYENAEPKIEKILGEKR